MDWTDHPIATAGDEILYDVLNRMGPSARSYGAAMFVCKRWLRAVEGVLSRRDDVFRFGALALPEAPSVTIDAPATRVTTRGMVKRQRTSADALILAARTPTCVAWHPTCAHAVVVGFADGTLRFYDARTGAETGDRNIVYVSNAEEERQMRLKSSAVVHMAFSQDGTRFLACWTDLSVVFRTGDPSDVAQLHPLPHNAVLWHATTPLTHGEFIPRSNLVAFCANIVVAQQCDDNTRFAWRHTPGARAIRFSPDGATSATLLEHAIHLHDVASRELRANLVTPYARGMLWSPDGARLLIQCPCAARLYTASTNGFRAAVHHDSFLAPAPTPACWSPDGRAAFFPDGGGGGGGAWVDVDAWFDDPTGLLVANARRNTLAAAVSPGARACMLIAEGRASIVQMR